MKNVVLTPPPVNLAPLKFFPCLRLNGRKGPKNLKREREREKRGRPNLRTKRTLVHVGTGVWGDVPPQKWRIKSILKIN